MTSHDSSDSAGQADARVCRSAVLLLRARQEAGPAGEDLAPPLGRLLSAVSFELEADRASIPTAVRCAAVRLAEHIVHRSPRDSDGRWPVPELHVMGPGLLKRAAGRTLQRDACRLREEA